jgi:hypothetical protein
MEQYPEIAQEYRKIVSTPMDLRTIKGKLSSYRTFKEFDEDVCLMYRNAENFNKYDKFLLPVSDSPSLSFSLSNFANLSSDCERDVQQMEEGEGLLCDREAPPSWCCRASQND